MNETPALGNDHAFERLVVERLATRASTIDVAVELADIRAAAENDGDRIRRAAPPHRHRWVAAAALVALVAGVLMWTSLRDDRTTISTRPMPTTVSTRFVVFVSPTANDSERRAIQGVLEADRDVASFRYEDRDETYRRFRDAFVDADPELLVAIRPEDLPTSFRGRLRRDADVEAFERRYRGMPGVFDTDLDPAGPSQSSADAARDGIDPAVARLSVRDRVHEGALQHALPPIADSPEGRWAISSLSPHTGGDIYSEILLLDRDRGTITRAFPFPGLRPQGLLLTDDALYCVRQGDGGVPESLVCRIDRRTFELRVRTFPSIGPDPVDPSLRSRLPRGSDVAEPIDYAAFDRLELRGTQDDGVLLTFGQGGSLSLDPRSLAVVGTGECEQPRTPSDQTLDTNGDVQLARISGWDPATRRLRFDVVGWGGPTPDADFSIIDDGTDEVTASVASGASVWLALTGDGDAALDRSDDAGIAALARADGAIAWLTLDRGTVMRICEQYHP